MSLSHKKGYASAEDAARSKAVVQFGHEVVEGCPCGEVHTQKPATPKATARKPARDTGPSRQTRAMVYARDLAHCAGCGESVEDALYSVQHRQARGMGGTSRPEVNNLSNLVLLCGSATSPGCHRNAEDRDPGMRKRGLWLESWERPEVVPVVYRMPDGCLSRRWLTDDGQRVPVRPRRAAA